MTLDFLDAELENDIKVEVGSTGQILHAVLSVVGVPASLSLDKQVDDSGTSV